jgi:hypothetical protein
MTMPRLSWIALALFAAGGCFQAGSDVQVSGGTPPPPSTGQRTSGSGRTAGNASAGGSSTTGGASTAGGTTGGITGGAASTGGAGGGTTGGTITCPAGEYYYTGRLVDLSDLKPVPGLAVSAYNPAGPPFVEQVAGSSTISDDGGLVVECIPVGQPVYLGIQGQGYSQCGTANFSLSANYDGYRRIGLLSMADMTLLAGYINAQHPALALDTSAPMIAVGIEAPTGSPCIPQIAGWSFSLSLPDGGPLPALPDGGLPFGMVYLTANGEPDISLTATTANGGVLFYDVQVPGTYVNLLSQNTNADAGCFITTSPLDLTGQALVAPSVVTFVPIALP